LTDGTAAKKCFQHLAVLRSKGARSLVVHLLVGLWLTSLFLKLILSDAAYMFAPVISLSVDSSDGSQLVLQLHRAIDVTFH
jgi:hypothetical protein